MTASPDIVLDGACTAMLPHAARLAATVRARDAAAVRGVLSVARAVPVPAGADPMDVLAVVLADMAPTAEEVAVIKVLRSANDPASVQELLEMLGLAGHGEPSPAMRRGHRQVAS